MKGQKTLSEFVSAGLATQGHSLKNMATHLGMPYEKLKKRVQRGLFTPDEARKVADYIGCPIESLELFGIRAPSPYGEGKKGRPRKRSAEENLMPLLKNIAASGAAHCSLSDIVRLRKVLTEIGGESPELVTLILAQWQK